MPNNDPTIQDVLDAVVGFAENTEGRFKKLEDDVTMIKSQMVTKSYLDEKMADLRGDLVVLTRKEDTKLKTLVEMLEEKKILSLDEKKKIFSLEPFPSLAL